MGHEGLLSALNPARKVSVKLSLRQDFSLKVIIMLFVNILLNKLATLECICPVLLFHSNKIYNYTLFTNILNTEM